jgi:predicted membrane protein
VEAPILMNKRIVKLRPFVIVLISVFAALDAVIRLVPVTYSIGLYKFFSLGWVFSPIMGILIGPIYGFTAATFGSLIRASIAPYKWTFGPFSPFLPALSALQAGLLTQRKHKVFFSILAFSILLSFTVIWLLLPTGRTVWPIALYYLAGLAAIPVVYVFFKSSKKWLMVALVITAYISNITQHALGNVLSVILLNLPAEVFWAALPLPLVEQTAFALASGVITLPILFALERANLLPYLNCGVFEKKPVHDEH